MPRRKNKSNIFKDSTPISELSEDDIITEDSKKEKEDNLPEKIGEIEIQKEKDTNSSKKQEYSKEETKILSTEETLKQILIKPLTQITDQQKQKQKSETRQKKTSKSQDKYKLTDFTKKVFRPEFQIQLEHIEKSEKLWKMMETYLPRDAEAIQKSIIDQSTSWFEIVQVP